MHFQWLLQEVAAQSWRSRKLSMLWCNFPEADIRAGAQHFATLDDCNADKVSFRCDCANGGLIRTHRTT